MRPQEKRQAWKMFSLLAALSLAAQGCEKPQPKSEAIDSGQKALPAEDAAKLSRVMQAMEAVPMLDPYHIRSQKIYWLAVDMANAKDFDQAIVNFSQYIEQFKKESRAIKGEKKEEHDYYLAWGYQWRGYCSLRQHNYEKAIQDLSEAIKLRPRYAVNYANRAKAYRLIGNLKLAQEDEAQVRSLPHSTGDPLLDLSREFSSNTKESK